MPDDPYRLDGRVVLVTGAARGIGLATCRRLLDAGASVVANDVDAEALDRAVAELAAGPRLLPAVADVADVSSSAGLVQRAVSAFGSLDVLVNNAGTFQPTPLDALDPELVDRLLALNVKGLLFLAAEAARVMQPGSSIVNISSLGGVRPPFPGLSAYHASKGAVDSLTRDMALEWGPRGIRVNGVGPGGILTAGKGQVTEHPRFPPDVMEQIVQRATARPLGRMGEPDDVATVVAFFASPASRFVTGQLLLVDGGYFYA